MRAKIHEELQEKVFRLMEALSGVDEELLARSEEAGAYAAHSEEAGVHATRSEKAGAYAAPSGEVVAHTARSERIRAHAVRRGGRKRSMAMWRYGKYLAACFAFLVLGVSAYSVSSFLYNGNKNGSSGGSADGSYAMIENCAPEENLEAAQSNPGVDGLGGEISDGGDPRGGVSGAAQSGPAETGYGKESAVADLTSNKNGSQISEAQTETQKENDEDAVVNNVPVQPYMEAVRDTSLTLETAKALAVVGAYVPGAMPEGYSFSYGVLLREQEGGGYDIELSFRNAGSADGAYIVLRITDCCAAAKAEGNAALQEQIGLMWPERKEERTFVTAEELTVDIFRTSAVVAVIYDSGVVVQYTGAGTPEEICEMFLSVQP